MTLIRFYVLADDNPSARERLACKLAAKGYREGIKTYLNMADASACQRINELLWTFQDQSFVPHEICSATQETKCAVGIGHDLEPDSDFRVLINLADEVPHFFSRFDKTLEIIDGREQTRIAGRSRYAFYKDRGYPLEKHPL